MDKRVLYFLLLLFAGSSCKKDFRDRFIGAYSFTSTYHEWNMSTGSTTTGPSDYQGTIGYGNTKEKVVIKYGADWSREVGISEGGQLSNCGKVVGGIDSNGKLILDLSSHDCDNSALGGGWDSHTVGQKN